MALTALAALAAAGCSDDGDAPPPAPTPDSAAKTDCAADGAAASSAPLLGGSSEPPRTGAALREGQLLAVGALVLAQSGGTICSATLVAPDVVLSAAHCVVDFESWDGSSPLTPGQVRSAGSLRFGVGSDMASPAALLEIAEVHVPSDLIVLQADLRVYPSAFGMQPDLALLVLRERADATVAAIEPIPIREQPLEGAAGAAVLLGGFGFSDAAQTMFGARYWTSFALGRANALTVELAPTAASAYTMPGDSGRGSWSSATTASSTPPAPPPARCTPPRRPSAGASMPHLDFVYAHVTTACSELGEVGRCDGDAARWCDGGRVLGEDCAANGRACGLDDCGNHRCLEPRDVDPRCAGLDYVGRCDGDVLEWCAGGAYRRRACADHGARCGLSDLPDGGYACLEELPAPPPDDALATCAALDACVAPCAGDMWCALDCYAGAKREALVDYGVFGRCTLCAVYPDQCEPGSPGSTCADACAGGGIGCDACITETCGASACAE